MICGTVAGVSCALEFSFIADFFKCGFLLCGFCGLLQLACLVNYRPQCLCAQ